MFALIVNLIGNYVLVVGAIILFMAPFFVAYRLHGGAPNAGFNAQLEHFFTSKHANWLVFCWAAAEALVWFVIPEFLLLLVVFMRIQRKRELLLFDIYGTVFGTLVALLLHLPHDALTHLPYVQPAMVAQVQAWFGDFGIFGLLFQPFSGVPYKVFTHLANDYSFFIPFFLLFAVVVRIARYYFAYTVFRLAYPGLHRFVYRNYVPLFFVATAIFSVLLYKVYVSYAG